MKPTASLLRHVFGSMSQSATSGVDLRHGGEIRAGLHCRNARCSEQSRRKAVTQSHGATAGQSATLAGPPAIHHGSTYAARSFFPSERRAMTFTYKLAQPLARLEHRTAILARGVPAMI